MVLSLCTTNLRNYSILCIKYITAKGIKKLERIAKVAMDTSEKTFVIFISL